ncbi:hypothetical protein FRC04_004013 [Tulasnella sp. 424]|nr:hypothetical protein FRC04_004013 [Tulasnella sp. 424]
MAATALTTQPYQASYFAMLESDPRCPPGIRNLQKWIESAWKEGYDSIGAQQLKHRLVGTTKWIGTGEIYVAMTWKGIPCELVDFPRSKYSRNQDTAAALIHWVVEYFSSSSSSPSQAPPPSASQASSQEERHGPQIIMSNHMPIVLQHNGHSRTIVGYELTKYGVTNLLIFDPARSIKEPLRKAALASHSRSKKQRTATPAFTPSPSKSSRKLAPAQEQNTAGPSTSPSFPFKPPPTPPSPPSRRPPSTKTSDDTRSIKSIKLITSFFHRNPSKSHLPALKRPFGKSNQDSPPKGPQESALSEDPIIIDSDSDMEGERGFFAKRTRGGGRPDDLLEVDRQGFPVNSRQPRKDKSRSPTRLRKTPQYAEEEDLDPWRTLSVFRVDLGQLSRHGEYQILYFPLTDPLNDQQKRDRMTVTSDRVVV